jgi:hypothetical protein
MEDFVVVSVHIMDEPTLDYAAPLVHDNMVDEESA